MKRKGTYYLNAPPIYCMGETVDKVDFVSDGFITSSAENTKTQIKILSIHEQGEIKCGPDFLEHTPSEFVIEATAVTYVVYLTYTQLQTIYQLFPETRELSTLIISKTPA